MSKRQSVATTSMLVVFGGITGMSFLRYLGTAETVAAALLGAAIFGIAGWMVGSQIDRPQSAFSQSDA